MAVDIKNPLLDPQRKTGVNSGGVAVLDMPDDLNTLDAEDSPGFLPYQDYDPTSDGTKTVADYVAENVAKADANIFTGNNNQRVQNAVNGLAEAGQLNGQRMDALGTRQIREQNDPEEKRKKAERQYEILELMEELAKLNRRISDLIDQIEQDKAAYAALLDQQMQDMARADALTLEQARIDAQRRGFAAALGHRDSCNNDMNHCVEDISEKSELVDAARNRAMAGGLIFINIEQVGPPHPLLNNNDHIVYEDLNGGFYLKAIDSSRIDITDPLLIEEINEKRRNGGSFGDERCDLAEPYEQSLVNLSKAVDDFNQHAEALRRAEENVNNLSAAQEALNARGAEIATELAELNRQIAERSQNMGDLDKNIRQNEQELSRLVEERSRLTSEMGDLDNYNQLLAMESSLMQDAATIGMYRDYKSGAISFDEFRTKMDAQSPEFRAQFEQTFGFDMFKSQTHFQQGVKNLHMGTMAGSSADHIARFQQLMNERKDVIARLEQAEEKSAIASANLEGVREGASGYEDQTQMDLVRARRGLTTSQAEIEASANDPAKSGIERLFGRIAHGFNTVVVHMDVIRDENNNPVFRDENGGYYHLQMNEDQDGYVLDESGNPKRVPYTDTTQTTAFAKMATDENHPRIFANDSAFFRDKNAPEHTTIIVGDIVMHCEGDVCVIQAEVEQLRAEKASCEAEIARIDGAAETVETAETQTEAAQTETTETLEIGTPAFNQEEAALNAKIENLKEGGKISRTDLDNLYLTEDLSADQIAQIEDKLKSEGIDVIKPEDRLALGIPVIFGGTGTFLRIDDIEAEVTQFIASALRTVSAASSYDTNAAQGHKLTLAFKPAAIGEDLTNKQNIEAPAPQLAQTAAPAFPMSVV